MYQVDDKGFFGKFGGAYVPEILYKCVTELQQAYKPIIESEEFKKEYHQLLRDYVGRPSPLYYAKRMSEKYGCQLYLKREDLNHTGAQSSFGDAKLAYFNHINGMNLRNPVCLVTESVTSNSDQCTGQCSRCYHWK